MHEAAAPAWDSYRAVAKGRSPVTKSEAVIGNGQATDRYEKRSSQRTRRPMAYTCSRVWLVATSRPVRSATTRSSKSS